MSKKNEFRFNLRFDDTDAVSYTHLDVYKRQIHGFDERRVWCYGCA